jgi:D-glycero-D-manno-heptose 1,7-bisphosphate phosphatase
MNVLFLDRDGVINRMVHYPHGWDSPQRASDVYLVPDIETIVLWANKRQIPVVLITNQPGVAKGKMTQKIADHIHQSIFNKLLAAGARIDKEYICPHHPNAVVPSLQSVCRCRKPSPGLLEMAAEEMDIDLSQSLFLGDKATDIIAGKSVGLKTILYIHSDDEPEKVTEALLSEADHHVDRLIDVIPILEEMFR